MRDLSFASFVSNSDVEKPSFIEEKNGRAKLLTKTQKDGLRYEKRVQEHLLGLLSSNPTFRGLCNPWLMFRLVGDSASSIKFCQPDFLLLSEEARRCIIVEIKLSHTADSWKQLRQLYEPVLTHILPLYSFALVEVCKWLDPHLAFPERFYYEENVFNAQEGKFGIHIYKPRGRSKARSGGEAL